MDEIQVDWKGEHLDVLMVDGLVFRWVDLMAVMMVVMRVVLVVREVEMMDVPYAQLPTLVYKLVAW